ncbi:RHS repeat-associated core domain containing protein-containing protein [Actinobacteria bacterium OV450]|nr:RHS repeat-associated core domain containing protein-containing protein [Actinobacteria bacterium OV450]
MLTLPGGKGKPVASIRYDGTAQFKSEVTGYDVEYRPTGSRITVPDTAITKGLAGSYAYSSTYTPTGKVQSTTVPATPGGLAAEKLITRYDRDGLPQSMSGLAWYTAETVYSPFGQILRTASGSAPNRLWTTNRYNLSTGQLTQSTSDREYVDTQKNEPHRISDVAYTYDVAGNITAVADTRGDGKTDRECYAYNPMGQLTNAWTGKACVGPTLADVTPGPDGDGFWQEYGFDAIGNRTKLIDHDLTNGALDDETTYRYEGSQPHALTKTEKTTRKPGSTINSLSNYTYDASGNTTTRRIGGDTQTLNWDRRNKLTTATSPGIGAVAVTGLSGKCLEVENGNPADGTPIQLQSCKETKAQQWRMTEGSVQALGKCLTAQSGKAVLAACDSANEYQKFTSRADKSLYNAKVNACLDVPAANDTDGTDLLVYTCGSGAANQQWNFADNTTTYVYGADGNRLIEETGSSRTLYLGEAEITVNKASQAVDAVRYYSSPGAPTTVRRTGGKTTGHSLSTLLADHHNTATTAVEMTAGQSVTRRKSDPYGNPRGAEPGNWPGSRSFLGTGIDDTNTGLTHIGAREYDSITGRFISVDPIIDISDPMQMNGYTYSNGNPVGYWDPTGLRLDDGTGHSEKPDGSSPVNPWTPGAKHPDNSDTKIGDGNGAYGQDRSKNTGKAGHVVVKIANKELPSQKQLMELGYSPGKTYVENLRRWADHTCYGNYNQLTEFCNTAYDIGLMSPTGDWMEVVGIRSAWECAKDPGFNKNCAMVGVDIAIAIVTRGSGKLAKTTTIGEGAALEESLNIGNIATKCVSHDSFVEGTLVLMADGTSKRIQDVAPGDEVLATDPISGETAPKTVTADILTQDDKTYVELTVATTDGDQIITTTDHHRFWSESDQAWTDAGEVQIGTAFRNDAGARVEVVRTQTYEARQPTYNLTVSDLHTYYVIAGATPVLVHNDDGSGMIGANGTQITSSTVWRGSSMRIDVENPSPGGRPGQMHLQVQINGMKSSDAPKYQYNFETGQFDGLPKNLQKELAKTDYAKGVKKGLSFLGEAC